MRELGKGQKWFRIDERPWLSPEKRRQFGELPPSPDHKWTSSTGPNLPDGSMEGRSGVCGNRGGRAYIQAQGKSICQPLYHGARQ